MVFGLGTLYDRPRTIVTSMSSSFKSVQHLGKIQKKSDRTFIRKRTSALTWLWKRFEFHFSSAAPCHPEWQHCAPHLGPSACAELTDRSDWHWLRPPLIYNDRDYPCKSREKNRERVRAGIRWARKSKASPSTEPTGQLLTAPTGQICLNLTESVLGRTPQPIEFRSRPQLQFFSSRYWILRRYAVSSAVELAAVPDKVKFISKWRFNTFTKNKSRFSFYYREKNCFKAFMTESK